jgi:cytochrome P450
MARAGWRSGESAVITTLRAVPYFDPSDPRWTIDPLPLFDELREEAPAHRTPDGYWVFSRHADCLAVLRDRRSSSDSLKVDPVRAPKDFTSPARAQQRAEIISGGDDTRPFLFRDPPDHTRLRGLVQRAFTPRTVAGLTDFVTKEADRLLDEALEHGTFDVVEALAWPLPVAVICEMLGVPPEDHTEFKATSAALARGLDPEFLLTDELRAARDTALLHFAVYFNGLFEERRRKPGDDLLSALVAAHDGEDRLSDGELLSTAILLLVAGHETTVNLLGGGTLALARDPGAQDRWRHDPSLDRTAPDELLRMTSPVQLTGRTLIEPMTIAGIDFEAGQFCMLLLGGANRDPAVFDDPTALVLDRDPNPHLGFGFGLHHCLGAPLARLEARIAMRRLLDRTSSFEVADDETVRYRPNLVLRGLARLDVTAQAA